MGKQSNSPEKYWRASVAVPVARKAAFDARMAELGLKTVGDLVNFVTLTPGVTAALGPLVPVYRTVESGKRDAADKRKLAIEKIKEMSAEQVNRLLELAEVRAQ